MGILIDWEEVTPGSAKECKVSWELGTDCPGLDWRGTQQIQNEKEEAEHDTGYEACLGASMGCMGWLVDPGSRRLHMGWPE